MKPEQDCILNPALLFTQMTAATISPAHQHISVTLSSKVFLSATLSARVSRAAGTSRSGWQQDDTHTAHNCALHFVQTAFVRACVFVCVSVCVRVRVRSSGVAPTRRILQKYGRKPCNSFQGRHDDRQKRSQFFPLR